MDPTLSDLLQLLRQAASPVDVFGPLAGDQAAALRRRYRELAAQVHPDQHPGAAAAAHEAFKVLQSWHRLAQQQLAQGAYGVAPRIDLSCQGRRYVGYAEPLRGDLCDLYPLSGAGSPLLLKLARHPRNNDLLAAEARALQQIERELAGQPVRAHFPQLADAFVVADAAGTRRQANVLRAEVGTLSLAAVLRARPQGLDPADAAWIFNRILAALATTHGLGLVHGAVQPEHVLIWPADHNGMLIDWCYSVAIGQPLHAICPPYAADYPPEVAARQPATPATDIYLAARCMVRLLGGSGDPATLPASVPAPLRALLNACLIPAPHRRPSDAWQVFEDFQHILRERYGPPAFRPFPLSA